MVEENHLIQIAELFGHPQPYIRCACHERRVRIGKVKRGEVVAGFRRWACRLLGRDPFRVLFQPLWQGGALNRTGGADDRGVARAAAEVPRKDGVVIGAALGMARDHRGDKPRGAEPALATVLINQSLLNSVEPVFANAFDRADSFAVQLGQEQDAGIQRTHRGAILHDDRAGTTIAFVTAFFGSCETAIFAQPIKQGPCRGLRDKDCLSIEKKRYLHRVLTCRLTKGPESVIGHRCGVEAHSLYPTDQSDAFLSWQEICVDRCRSPRQLPKFCAMNLRAFDAFTSQALTIS